MKTTIDIPDALAQAAKDVARDQGSTLRDLVVTGLRHEVERRSTPAKVDFVFPAVDGHGLVLDVPPTEVIAASYGLPA